MAVVVGVFGPGRVGCVIAPGVRVDVGARGHHRPHGGGADQDGRCDQPRPALLLRREECAGVGGDDGEKAERGTRSVGELSRLSDFETVDPRDPEHPRGEPSGDRGGVDCNHAPRSVTCGTNQCPDADADLEDGSHDEDPGQLGMLRVDTCG